MNSNFPSLAGSPIPGSPADFGGAAPVVVVDDCPPGRSDELLNTAIVQHTRATAAAPRPTHSHVFDRLGGAGDGGSGADIGAPGASSIQNCQSGGACGHDGSGVHPCGGVQPGACAGHPGGGLNLQPMGSWSRNRKVRGGRSRNVEPDHPTNDCTDRVGRPADMAEIALASTRSNCPLCASMNSPI